MAKGDYDATELQGMARATRAVSGLDNPQAQAAAAAASGRERETATNALRVLPQLTAADLQVCIAFGISPFAYMAAKLEMGEEVATERQARIDRLDREQRYRSEQHAWGLAEIERLRNL